MKNIILLFSTTVSFMILFFSCEDDVGDIVDYKPQIVVEGQIENDKYASVHLSWSAPFNEIMDTTSMLNLIIKTAKVTISNGSHEEVLLLRPNWSRLPPYEYVSTRMKGKVGEKYYLKIECDGKVITSETFIPEPVNLDDLWYVKTKESDKYGYIHVRFKNKSDYAYLLSTQIIGEEGLYTPCLYGVIDNKFYSKDEEVSLQINRGMSFIQNKNYATYFQDTCVVRVKLATQPYEGYHFWQSYQNASLNSENPLFPSTSQLKSNIDGALGFWLGYGSSTKTINLRTYK